MNTQLTKWSAPIAISIAVFFAAPAAALACSFVIPQQPMEISDEQPQAEPDFPAPVVLEAGHISRGENPNVQPVSSCADLGSLAIEITGYDEEYGLVFEFQGQHPDTFEADEDPLRFDDQHLYQLVWGDQDTRGEVIDLTVTARWIDEYGRMGPESDPLNIYDEGVNGTMGCSTTDSSTPPTTMMLLLLAMGLVISKRRRVA